MKRKHQYIRIFLFIFLIVLSFQVIMSLYYDRPSENTFRASVKHDSIDKNWFYEVYNENHLIIKQQYIPGVQGRQYFQSKRDAEVIALLVVKKLQKGGNPNIEVSELEEFNINFKN